MREAMMAKTPQPKGGERLPKGVPASDLPTKKGAKNKGNPYETKTTSRKK
jgi:hypothetical protein